LSAGVRRIEAVTGFNAVRYLRELETELTGAALLVKGTMFQTRDKVDKTMTRQKEMQREIEALKRQLMSGGSKDLTSEARKVGDITVLSGRVDVSDPAAMREMADKLRDKLDPAVIVLGAVAGPDKVTLVCTVSKSLTGKYQAGKVIKEVAGKVGGGGGGRPDFAQAGGSQPDNLDAALAHAYTLITV
jgi:alanyl-tRNA synthetase